MCAINQFDLNCHFESFCFNALIGKQKTDKQKIFHGSFDVYSGEVFVQSTTMCRN